MVISDCPTSSNSANPISWCMYACGGTPLRFTRRFFLRQTLLYLRLGLLIFTATCVSAQGPFPDSFNPSASNGTVIAVAEQLDGRILVGGGFNSLGGQLRNRIGRIEADGTLDKGFDPNALPTFLRAVAVQTDGAIIVGGDFTTLSGQLRNRVGRINENGTVDASFNPGANSNVFAMSLQSDGKILIGGAFTAVGGQTRLRLARLNVDGTVDVGFDPAPNGLVEAITIQNDGKILIGGVFTSVGGQPRTRIARLNTDGSVDVGFNPGAGNTVNCVAVQADGKVLVGGTFGSLGGQVRNYLGRVNSDGTIDTGFNPGANSVVNTLAVQVDGKIVVGGNFSNLGGQSRSCLGRLNADGTIDSGFNPGASAFVFALALQADGKLLVGGNFSTLGGQLRERVGRLNSTGVTTQSLSVVDSTFTWLRSGSLPEIWQATFDYSPDGRNWTNMGAGVRIPEGWQLSVPSVPVLGAFRARGSVAVADSSYFVADYFGMPALVSQPLDRTNNAGTTSRFSVLARGTGQLGYQWLKNGTALLDGGNVSGANSRELVLSNVLAADFGDYSVAVSNSFGVVTSRVAQLSVIDPVIVGYTSEQLRQGGQDVTLSVNAAGTAPMSYYWLKDGAPTDGAAGSSLSLTNLQGADAGGYQVIVSNLYGSVTSVVLWLSVNLASVDAGFNAGVGGDVESISVQTDGKTLVAGDFQLMSSHHRYFARLNRDGTADVPFDAQANGRGTLASLQADGRILLGGYFGILGSQERPVFGRLRADGQLDTPFDLRLRYNDNVSSVEFLQDGKFLILGGFTNVAGIPRTNIARLNSNGTVDSTFAAQIQTGWLPGFSALAIQNDGKILVGGWIYQSGGLSRPYLGRLDPSGSVDTNFTANINYDVRHIVVQPDGKVLIAGGFTRVDGLSRTNLARLNPDGSLDQQFIPPGFSDVRSIALQADGKILVAAPFVLSDKQSRKHLVRLKTDGTIDGTFSPEVGAVAILNSVAIMDDGHVLIGGRFSTINGLPRNNLARLNPSEPAVHRLSVEGDTITWQFGGSAPQLAWAYFEHSMNGVIWNRVGSATPISDGWQISGASIPNAGTLRARGYVASSDAVYFIEDFYGPLIIQQPSSRTNNAGSVASFAVTASGSGLTNYQWLKNGIPVANGPNLDGATGPVLTLSNVLKNDEGTYRVHVSNFEGSLTSVVARLTVIDPFISVHPQSQTHERGGSATLSIAATGTEPLACQWWHNGLPVSGATGFALSLTNLGYGDNGDYFAVVSNSFGSVTSSTAAVTINLATLDESFNPGTSSFVSSLAIQPDGRILVGGAFTTLGGLSSYNFTRLLPDGTGDTGFPVNYASDIFGASPHSFVVHVDGFVFASGNFNTLFGQPRAAQFFCL